MVTEQQSFSALSITQFARSRKGKYSTIKRRQRKRPTCFLSSFRRAISAAFSSFDIPDILTATAGGDDFPAGTSHDVSGLSQLAVSMSRGEDIGVVARLGEFVESLAPRVRAVVGVLFPIPLNPRPTAVRGFGSMIVGAGALSKAPDRNWIKEHHL